jgi:hypothetical protein
MHFVPILFYFDNNMTEGRGVCRVLVGQPEGKTLLGRPRRRWEDNLKADLHEVVCGV